MIGLIAIYALRNWKEQVKKEWLRIGITLGFGGLGVLIKYYVWDVLGKSFIRDLILVRKRLGGSM